MLEIIFGADNLFFEVWEFIARMRERDFQQKVVSLTAKTWELTGVMRVQQPLGYGPVICLWFSRKTVLEETASSS